MNKYKKGLIAISYRFLDENPDAVLKLFGEIGFLPMRINHDMIADMVEYAGYSESFRELSEGETIPSYQVLNEAGKNGELVRTWVEETKWQS